MFSMHFIVFFVIFFVAKNVRRANCKTINEDIYTKRYDIALLKRVIRETSYE